MWNYYENINLFILQIIVLLDLTSDQSMIDEGLSREAINRIQKLRKKVNIDSFMTLLKYN